MPEAPRSNPTNNPHPDDNTRIADIMSRSVRTVRDDEQVLARIHELRLIGHEGYPVVDAAGRVVGLLTMSVANRAAEHRLEYRVRDVMIAGEVVVSEDDLVTLLVKRMNESGWGQIPVVDAKGAPVGIVTRTDLIAYWASRQSPPDNIPDLSEEKIAEILGHDNADLIALMGRAAEKHGVRLYIVGGIVRDLLLGRTNLDIDFVVEGDAIAFAEALAQEFGGQVISFRPFGTAKWTLKDAERLPLQRENLPYHVDLATSRDEFYEKITVLPTVYQSSIRPDLARRDFTINTLALQLNPPTEQGRVIDIFGGVKDLQAGVIRVLHSVSFAEDPTRILRAMRFAGRLGFRIEARTDAQIDRAIPNLHRVTGERLRNELRVLLGEKHAPATLKRMSERGILRAIHPDFQIDAGIARLDEWQSRADKMPDWVRNVDQAGFVWGVLLASLTSKAAQAVCDRLLLGKTLTEQIIKAVKLVKTPDVLSADGSLPSQISARLNGIDDAALAVAWVWLESPPLIRDRLSRYVEEWRAIQPLTTGHTLQLLGLPPGPCYKKLLDRLRDARRDGDVTTADEEKAFVLDQVEKGLCK